MKIKLLLSGQTDNKHLSELMEEYIRRISHYVKFETEIVSTKLARYTALEEIKRKESENLLAQIHENDYVILLDEKGTMYSSEKFALHLQKQFNKGFKKIVFVIGGAYGFSQAMYKRANELLSLSLMTFSHQMVRIFFVEQLYRAFTILNGEKYHH